MLKLNSLITTVNAKSKGILLVDDEENIISISKIYLEDNCDWGRIGGKS